MRPINPFLKNELLKKAGLGFAPEITPEPMAIETAPVAEPEPDFSDEARLAVRAEMDQDQNSTSNTLSKIGLGLSSALAAYGGDNGRLGQENDEFLSKKDRNREESFLGNFDKRKKAYGETQTQNRANAKADIEFAKSDPNSQASVTSRTMLKANFPEYVKLYGKDFDKLTAADTENFLNPIKLKESMSERDLKRQEMSNNRAIQNGIRQDNMVNRAAERSDARAFKQAELTPARAKQMGLYNSGTAAEEQYLKSVADKNEYDPTSVGQVIDNSDWAPNFLKNNKAIESKSAQNAWTESFLRDASGAAIPESERGSYIDIFFPQPGDTKTVVENKKKLRDEKMRSAALGAGMSHNVAIPNQDAAQRQVPSKPKSIQQNGHTYTINPQTGEYE